MRRPSHVLLVAFVFAAAIQVPAAMSPEGVLAASPTPTAPLQIRYEIGTHVGYTFSNTGAILTSKTTTMAKVTYAHTTQRKTIPGRGVHYRISDGSFAGYYVRESIAVYIPGSAAEKTFSPASRISFPAGTIMGYSFDSSWRLVSAASMALTASSSASADRFAVISGIRFYHLVNGGLAGRWVPAAAAGSAKALGCRTGPRASGSAQVYTQVAGAGPELSLTFDLGGRTDPAMAIVKRLLLYGVCTTLFPTGDAAASAAGADVLRFAARYPQVFEIGNHTKDHCNLVNGGGDTACPVTRPSTGFVQSQLTSAATTISAVTGQNPKPYWRPPYGSHDAAVRSAAAAVGYPKTVMWHIDTIDWRPPPPTDTGPTAVQIIDKVVRGAANGSIVLMHLGGWKTYPALPSMVDRLRQRGLEPTTISDLVDGR